MAGKIKINPANKGKYTARAKANGNTVQQQASKDLASPKVSGKIKKRANFAKNAKGFKH
jgi:multidrug efflux pump subunit AcrA (membrane-fusion protein)